MIRLRLSLALSAVALAACAKDPTAGKARAEVAAARPEAPAPGAGERIPVVAASSRIGFVGAKITAQHAGHFGDFGGTIYLTDGDPRRSRVEIEIRTASLALEDGPARLERHLRSPDFFDVERFPTARFVSTAIEPLGGIDYRVTGNLELRGVKKSITFPAKIEVTPESVAVTSELGIDRKDFGIVYPGAPDDLIKDNVLIQVSLKAARGTSRS